MTDQVEAVTSYSRNSAFWIDIIRRGRDRFRTELTDNAVLALLGPTTQSRVLDLGCGEGYLSRLISQRGSTVVGVDIEEELLRAARSEALRCNLAIDYVLANMSDLPLHFENTFDVVVLNHSVNDLENPAPMLSEVARVLLPGGNLIMLMLHPCFAHDGIAVRHYFSNFQATRFFEVDGTISPAPVTYWVQPLESYSRLLSQAGFTITSIQEPHPTLQQLSDTWWQRNFTTPKFLLISAKKGTSSLLQE